MHRGQQRQHELKEIAAAQKRVQEEEAARHRAKKVAAKSGEEGAEASSGEEEESTAEKTGSPQGGSEIRGRGRGGVVWGGRGIDCREDGEPTAHDEAWWSPGGALDTKDATPNAVLD